MTEGADREGGGHVVGCESLRQIRLDTMLEFAMLTWNDADDYHLTMIMTMPTTIGATRMERIDDEVDDADDITIVMIVIMLIIKMITIITRIDGDDDATYILTMRTVFRMMMRTIRIS
jgi:hypothetical protein